MLEPLQVGLCVIVHVNPGGGCELRKPAFLLGGNGLCSRRAAPGAWISFDVRRPIAVNGLDEILLPPRRRATYPTALRFVRAGRVASEDTRLDQGWYVPAVEAKQICQRLARDL